MQVNLTDSQTNSAQSQRSKINIVKGLGIIAIVLGHSCSIPNVGLFVYGYHLALFFFVSGVTFNDGKYALSPHALLQARIKSLWPGYFLYMSLFTLTHNITVLAHMQPPSEMYGISGIVFRLWNNFLFCGSELFGGALWFVPVLLIAMMAFSLTVYLATRFCGKLRILVIVLVSAVFGLGGVIANLGNMNLMWHTQTSILVVPIICAGYLFNRYSLLEKRIFHWYIALPCLVFLHYFIIENGYQIELSAELIGGKYLFYPLSFAGVYLIFYVATLLDKVVLLRKVFSFVGQYSFDIMAMHFFIMKLVDVIFGTITGQAVETIYVFPTAYGYLWPIHLLASLTIAPFLRICANKVYRFLCDLAPVPYISKYTDAQNNN